MPSSKAIVLGHDLVSPLGTELEAQWARACAGESGVGYLSRFPLDRLKIDQGFVRDITTEPRNAAIARATIALAQGLDMVVIAEGVESESQLRYLRDIGCEEIQGYLFSRPVPPEALAEMLGQGKTLSLDGVAQ